VRKHHPHKPEALARDSFSLLTLRACIEVLA
jgi:hypothetical protein